MAGGDNYKEFDTSSIVSSNTGKDSVTFGRVTLRKRDALLGGIAIIACLCVIILAIVLAVEVGSKSSDCSSSPSTSGQTGKLNGTSEPMTHPPSTPPTPPTPPPSKAPVETSPPVTCPTPPGNNMCDSPPCLQVAFYEKTNMNENVDPCTNFYEFACGGYAEANPVSYQVPQVSPTIKIVNENVEKLVTILASPADRRDEESYERKLKHFMQSCNNHFDKMSVGGIPLINKVIKPAGGWYVLNETWDTSSFDFHSMLTTVHIKFWTTAFFNTAIKTDQTDWTKKVVELDFGGIGVSYVWYGNNSVAAQVQPLYKAYMRHIARLLTTDARVDLNMTKINQFVDDAYEVEEALAKVILKSPLLENPHEEDSRMTLAELNRATKNAMDFVDYFKMLFYEHPEKISGSFKVAVRRLGYFNNLGTEIETFLATDEGKRKVHNYFIWQLINRYVGELSWEYVHAKRQLSYYLVGNKDTSSGYSDCFNVALTYMSDAVNAVYVEQHVNENDRKEAMAILEYVKDALVEEIQSASWMTPADKTIAVNKIKNSLYKIGYPDYLVDTKLMDSLYDSVDIDVKDYFENILNLNKVSKKYFNIAIDKPNSRNEWAYGVFNPVVEYYNPWHELIATAAVLQYPLFSHQGPTYYNFGGIGTILAASLVHAVDEFGNSYELDGSHFGEWWHNVTKRRYADIKQCAINAQKDEVLGPFTIGSTSGYKPNITLYSTGYAPTLLSDSSGLRLSYKAFKASQQQKGTESVPAGLHYHSADKLFFIAYAQAYCQNTPDHLLFSQLYTNGRYPSKNKINLAVSQVKEFKEAFGCKADQPLVAKTQCKLF